MKRDECLCLVGLAPSHFKSFMGLPAKKYLIRRASTIKDNTWMHLSEVSLVVQSSCVL